MRRLLDLLTTADHFVLHDLEMRHGHVDHVVVGPSGTYVVEPVRWRGTVSMGADGQIRAGVIPREGAKRRALEQATYVRRQLAASGVDQHVIAILAPTAAKLPHGPLDLRTALVVEADDLPGFIRRRVRRLDTPQVHAIRDELAPLARRR